MIHVRRTRRQTSAIDISPMIDIVFLLLIFFMVTTSFVRETGIDVERPCASTAVEKSRGNILVSVSADDEIFFEGSNVDPRRIRTLVSRSLAENPDGSVIVIPDKNSSSGKIIEVMDQCRLAGARNISLAAKRTP